MGTIGSVIAAAFAHSKETIPFVLEGAFNKHGNTPSACGSHFQTGCDTQGGVEHMLFYDLQAEWKATVYDADANLLIAETPIPEGMAVTAAVALDDLPPDQGCLVKSLGAHPTLVTVGMPVDTDVVTAIVELDGDKDPDLDGMGLEGKPVLVTWHPGKALPPSQPHDCKVGDRLTVAEAIEKGWRVVALEATWEALTVA